MRKRKYLSALMATALGVSSLVGIQPAFATSEIAQVNQTSVESPVGGYLTIQNEWGKTPIYAGEITAGQAIPISSLQTGKEYQVSISGESLYFGNLTIDANGKANLDLYTLETEENERSLFSAIEYESEPNNTRNKANPLRSNTIYGKIDKKNDKDFFKVTIPSSGDYAFVLDKIPATKDYDLYLYNEKGKVVAVSAGASSTEIIRHSGLSANEVYYLEVRGYKGDFDKTETYRLQYSQVKSFSDDHGNNREQATKIETDKEIAGNIDYPKDVDYFTFTAPSDGNYSIYTTGNTDTEGHLYDAGGKLLAQNDTGENWNFKIEESLTKDEQYYVAVSHSGIGTGSYTLFVKSPTVTPTEPNAGNSFDTATPINIDESKNAWFENSQDARYFVFTPSESGSYGFYTEGDADTYGKLIAQDKVVTISENDNSGKDCNFSIANTLLAGQTYYIQVTTPAYEAVKIAFSMKVRKYDEPNGLSNQYHLLNKDYAMDSNVLPAWIISQGEGVKVAVADSGIDYNHPSLKNNLNLALSYNFTHNITDIFPIGENVSSGSAASNGHGTHVSGIVAANGENIYGVAPKATLVGYKVLGTRIPGNDNYTGSITAFVNAIKEAQAQGIRIMNCSFGGVGASALEQEAMKNASDILFVISAGNAGKDLAVSPEYPACYYLDHSLVVAAADNDGLLAPYSNYGGPTAILAFGTAVKSTIPNGFFGEKTGTSMATPIVTGVSALVMGKYPTLNSIDVKNIIIAPDNISYMSALNGKVTSAGMINAFKAVTNDGEAHLTKNVNEVQVSRDPFSSRDVKNVITEIKNTTTDSEKTDSIIVKISSNISIDDLIDILSSKTALNFALTGETAVKGAFEIKANSVTEADQLVDTLNKLSEVIYAEPDYIRTGY